jgi:hypothetical protein
MTSVRPVAAAARRVGAPGANVFYGLPGYGGSVYSDIEDSQVGGNLSITGALFLSVRRAAQQFRWQCHVLRPHVHGLGLNRGAAQPGGRYLPCADDSPAVQFGDADQSPNSFRGYAAGQCSFARLVPDPGAQPPASLPFASHDPTDMGYWLLGADGCVFDF